MQAKRITEAYDSFEPVFDGRFETSIEADFTLPDYCPDIQRVLKCQVSPEVTSTYLAEDLLTVEGTADIRVLYLDARSGALRCCDLTRDFSATAKLKPTGEKAVAWVRASVERLSCRAVSARRLELRAGIGLTACALVQRQEQITADLEEENVEKRTGAYTAARAVNAVSHQFTVEDELVLKNGKPPIGSILRRGVTARLSECRPAGDSLHLSGSAELSFLYLSAADGETVEKMSVSLPFEQTVQCLGADENCTAQVRLVPGEIMLTPREDDMGEATELTAAARMFAVACVYAPCSLQVIDDAYSVCSPLELQFGQLSLTQLLGSHEETVKKKWALSLQENELGRVLDLWLEQESAQSTCERGRLNTRVCYTVCLLALDGEGRVQYTEKQADFNCPAELENDAVRRADTAFHNEIWEYRILDKSTVEVTVETGLESRLSARPQISCLTGAELGEQAAGEDTAPRLVLYYAQRGERLWDIAKSHRAMLRDLREENGLYDDLVPEDRPILICNR